MRSQKQNPAEASAGFENLVHRIAPILPDQLQY
jgi:hypothetical protein